MIYSNFEFIIFAVITLSGFLLLKNHYTLRFYLLLFSSLFFYAWYGYFDLIIFLIVIGFSWYSAYASIRYPNFRKFWIFSGILVMVAHLFFWKYTPWIVHILQRFDNGILQGRPLTLPLPVGISFFTLQGIAYLVDLYKKKTNYIGFRQYLLFKSFFPQLVAGPIVRSNQLNPQLMTLRNPQVDQIYDGVLLFVLGFFKKVAMADRMAPVVEQVFANPSVYSRIVLLQAALGYSVQIWGDFSGYTDMGRGIAKMFGVILPENFLSPYLACSPSEFWKRWHISLSEWIRDYVYIPLGGKQGTPLRVIAVALVTMIISGLWHGAAFTFLFWGFYHGCLLVIERFATKSRFLKTLSTKISNTIFRLVQGILMFTLVTIGWIIFRSQHFSIFSEFIVGLYRNQGISSVIYGGNVYPFLFICFFIQFIEYYSFSERSYCYLNVIQKFITAICKDNTFANLRALVSGLGLALFFWLGVFLRFTNISSKFIYFQF